MNTTTPNPVTRAARRYHVEFAASMLAYVATMGISRNALQGPLRNASDTTQLLVALSPEGAIEEGRVLRTAQSIWRDGVRAEPLDAIPRPHAELRAS